MKRIGAVVFMVILLASCKPGQKWRKDDIEKREKALMEEARKGKTDTSTVNALLQAYESYAADFPSDTTGANYLFKAGDFYRYMHQPAKCIADYEKIYNNYPTFVKRPYALFLQGFIYENEMKNIEAARTKYQQFLTAYPDHAIARDVKITMDNLGKSPEDLIKEFEAKQQADSLQQAKGK